MNRDVIDLSSDLRHTSVVELDLRILRVRCVAESAGRWCFSPYHFLLSIGFITMKLATLALLCGSAAAFAPSQSSKVRMGLNLAFIGCFSSHSASLMLCLEFVCRSLLYVAGFHRLESE